MSVVEELEQIFSTSVPQDITSSELGRELRRAMAETLAMVSAESDALILGSQLRNAVGRFADLHAKDRGLRRQAGETDQQLYERLRKPPSAVTLEAIKSALEVIVGAAGPVVIIELPRRSLYLDRAVLYGTPSNDPETQYAMCLDRSNRCGGGRGVVVALIPSSANAVDSVTDALRSKVSAGKLWLVHEYDNASVVARSAIYYPTTPSIMGVATVVGGSSWTAGWLLEESELEDARCEPRFASSATKSLSITNALGLTRVAGLRAEAHAIELTDGSSQFLSSSSGMNPGAGGFKIAFVVKFNDKTHAVMGYGSIFDAGWFLLHGGTGSADPPPGVLRLSVGIGANSASVNLGVPDDEWIVVFGCFGRGDGKLTLAYAGLGISNSVSVNSSAVVGSLTSAIDDSLRIGAAFGTTADTPIDAIWYSAGDEIVSANVETSAQNLYNFITRP